jgi:hypothetical protein
LKLLNDRVAEEAVFKRGYLNSGLSAFEKLT